MTLAAMLLLVTGCNNPYSSEGVASNTLYLALSDDPSSMDPHNSYDVPSATVIDVIFPSYYRYHYLKQKPFQLELNLGANEPKREKNIPVVVTSKDAKTGQETKTTVKGERWTFTLKKGIRFQDDKCFTENNGKGREVTAQDLLYSFKRIADPEIHSPVLSFIQDKIQGYEEFHQKLRDIPAKERSEKSLELYQGEVEGLVIPADDPYTLVVTLIKPYPQLRYLMAMHFLTPMAYEAVDYYKKEIIRNPVGCGPYVLKEYKKRQRIVLEKNPNRPMEVYPSTGDPGDAEKGLLADAGKQLPLADTVNFTIVRESMTSWNMFLQGYLDAATINQQNYQQAMSIAGSGQLSEEMKAKNLRLERVVNPDFSYFAFNMDDPVVGGFSESNRKLRRAISLAVDSQTEIELLRQGIGNKAEFMIPPGLFGYDDKYKNPYRDFDPELKKAKQLLAEAGYPGGIDPKTGKKLKIFWDNYNNTPAGRQETNLVLQQLNKLGIEFEPRTWRFPIFRQKVETEGQFQFMSAAWIADYPDPENFIFLVYGKNKRPGPNYSNYINPKFDALFEKMQAMDDGPERQNLINEMRQILEEDCPFIFRTHSENFVVANPWYVNYKPNPVAQDVLKYRRADGALRRQKQIEWNSPIIWPLFAGILVLSALIIPAVRVVQARTKRYVRKPNWQER